MGLLDLLAEEVTIQTATAGDDDRYGNPTTEYTDSETYRARLEQVDASELLARGDTQVTEWRLFLPGDAVISSQSRVTHPDEGTFEVVGEPAKQKTPRGVHHVEARLRRVT